jgi:hypothetical protein
MKNEYKELIFRLGIETLDWIEDLIKDKLNERNDKNECERYSETERSSAAIESASDRR